MCLLMLSISIVLAIAIIIAFKWKESGDIIKDYEDDEE